MEKTKEAQSASEFIFCRNTYCTVVRICRRGDHPPRSEPYLQSVWVGPKRDRYGRNLECPGYLKKDEAIN